MKITSPITQPTFQKLNSHMWQVATLLTYIPLVNTTPSELTTLVNTMGVNAPPQMLPITITQVSLRDDTKKPFISLESQILQEMISVNESTKHQWRSDFLHQCLGPFQIGREGYRRVLSGMLQDLDQHCQKYILFNMVYLDGGNILVLMIYLFI